MVCVTTKANTQLAVVMHPLKPIATSDFALQPRTTSSEGTCARDVPDEEARDTACEIRSTRKIAGFVGAYPVVVENDSRHLPQRHCSAGTVGVLGC